MTYCKMSFVRSSKVDQFAAAPSQKGSKDLHIRIDVAPIPTGASVAQSAEQRGAQATAANILKTAGKDLFMENKTLVSTNAGERLYQTKDLYGQNLSLEALIPQLTKANLTLRVNAVRESEDAHNTCMELKTGILADIMQDTGDSNREKSTTLEIPSASEKGQMFVTVKEIKGKHYINKVDYKVGVTEDNKLHVK